MTSIRFRLFMLLLIYAGSATTFAGLAFINFKDHSSTRGALELSYLIREEVQDLPQLKSSPERQQRLLSLAPRLLPKSRGEQLTTLVLGLKNTSARMENERHQIFIKNEVEYQRFSREQLNYFDQKVLYFAGLALLVLVFGFVVLQVFVQRAVIGPMKDLSRKMVDFVDDRYTYQFSVPTPDEFGHMQATFNSLAQRVISNVEQLKTLDQAKSDFLSIASHELRTPLTSIKGSLSLMRSGVVGKMNEMAENLMTIAENETDRLIRLINDLLDLAKIEARKLPLHQDWQSWNALVTTCLQSLQGLAQQAEVQLIAAPTPSIEAYMDKDRVQQVLTNLVSNAIKFSPKGQPVTVSAEINERNELVISVSDRGRGIAPQDQEAIFQKFRQATNANNPLVKGTGLGLAIAKALVEQHGGEIGVHSTPGEGSTFYFVLPEWRYGLSKASEAAA